MCWTRLIIKKFIPKDEHFLLYPKSMMFTIRLFIENSIIHSTKLCLPATSSKRNFYKFIKYQKYLHINWTHNSLRKSRLFYMKIYRSLKHVFAYTSEHINYFMKIFTFFLLLVLFCAYFILMKNSLLSTLKSSKSNNNFFFVYFVKYEKLFHQYFIFVQSLNCTPFYIKNLLWNQLKVTKIKTTKCETKEGPMFLYTIERCFTASI